MTYQDWTILSLSRWGIGLGILVILLGAGSVFLAWPATRRLQNRRLRHILFTLRSLAILLILFALFEPALQIRNLVVRTNHIAVLVDASRSMDLLDGGKTRWQKTLDFLKEVQIKSHDYAREITLDLFSVTNKLTPITFSALSENKIQPDGDTTDLGQAISELKTLSDPPQAIYLLSDGADRGRLFSAFTSDNSFDFNLPQNVPIHTIATGHPSQIRDLAITGVAYDDFGFIKTPLTFDVHLVSLGFSNAKIPITLKVDGAVLLTKEVEIDPQKTHYDIPMTFTPNQLGRFLYTLSVPVYEGETVVENNTITFIVKIVRDKIRVLHVCGKPSWDERFLRKFLKSKPDIDLISFFILRTLNDLPQASTQELSLIPFPKDELFTTELEGFDLLIFQNFDYRPYQFPRSYLENIERFVLEGGGGFVMIGGDLSFLGGGYRHTAVERILPIDLPQSGEIYQTGPFKPTLTPEGLLHPIMQLSPEAEENTEIFKRFPELDGTNTIGQIKPMSTVLLEHPKLKSGNRALPIIAVMDAGKGRSISISTDTLWFWNLPYIGQGGNNRSYIKFWENAIHWLIRDPSLEQVVIQTQESNMAQSEPVLIETRVFDHDYRPRKNARVKIVVSPANLEKGLSKQTFQEDILDTDENGRTYVSFTPPPEGGHFRVYAEAFFDGRKIGEDQTLFTAQGNLEEKRNPQIYDDLLQWIAEKTGGTFQYLDQAKFKIDPSLQNVRRIDVSDQRIIPLWNHSINDVLIVTLLTLAWYLGRRAGLS